MTLNLKEHRQSIQIGKHFIGPNHPPFIVAEMSGNHNGSLDRALQIVEAAAHSGVQALKLQTYTADTMTLNLSDREFVINDPDSLWFGKSLYELYREAHTPWVWHKIIFKRCAELGIVGFSSPFDYTAVDFLESLNVPCYKIASFENTDLPLIRKVASTKKLLIISTGLATLDELGETVQTAREAGCKDLILLKCTSNYPASPDTANLRTLLDMKERFNVEVGLSDHTLGSSVSVASISAGAVVIEKHFTLNRADGGVDSAFSLEPEEMKRLVRETNEAWKACGTISYGPNQKEKSFLVFRRSLYATKDIAIGEKLTKENVRAIRPGLGLPPKFYDLIIGKKVKKQIKKGTPIQLDCID